MGPTVRSVHECFDVFNEKMTTEIKGDAWDDVTFSMTDEAGLMSGTLDGAVFGGACARGSFAAGSADAASRALVLAGRFTGLPVCGGGVRAALHASRVAGAGVVRLGCTLRLHAASVKVENPATSLDPRVELHAPLPRGAGTAAAWAAYGGLAGASVQLRRGGVGAAAAVSGRFGSHAHATLSADVALGGLAEETVLGAEWRSAEPRVARLRARHTRPGGVRFGGVYVAAEARLSPDERFTRKDLQLFIGRRFRMGGDADAAEADAADDTK